MERRRGAEFRYLQGGYGLWQSHERLCYTAWDWHFNDKLRIVVAITIHFLLL